MVIQYLCHINLSMANYHRKFLYIPRTLCMPGRHSTMEQYLQPFLLPCLLGLRDKFLVSKLIYHDSKSLSRPPLLILKQCPSHLRIKFIECSQNKIQHKFLDHAKCVQQLITWFCFHKHFKEPVDI